MKKNQPLILATVVLCLAALACNLPSAREPAGATDVGPTSQETPPTQVTPDAPTLPPTAPSPTETPPEDTPTPTDTPTVTPTDTPSIPMVTVTKNTNCRSGPGTVYDLIYIFMTDDAAEITGRSSVSNYIIIKVPDSSGRTCWLWTQYAVITGDINDLPESTPPPTPTPAFNFDFAYETVDSCPPNVEVFMKVTNTGGMNIESRHISAKDLDTSETKASQTDMFGDSPTCVTTGTNAIPPGATKYVSVGFTPPIGGHSISVTIKACAQDGLGEPCLSKTKTFNIPSASDVNAKENFETVDTAEILNLLSELPITTWNYLEGDPDARHIGPMAQDFNPLFDVGEYKDYISAIDSSGVALAAIQELSTIAERQADQIEQLERQNAVLNARLQTLEAKNKAQPWLVAAYLIPSLVMAGAGILILKKKERRGNT